MAGRLRTPLSPRDEARMTLIEHLEEFRSRLFRVAIAFVLACIGTWIFRRQIFEWLLEPANLDKLTFMGPAQGLMTDVKLSLFSAFLVTVPVVIYHAWMFVAPAVGEVGRAFTYVIVTLSSLLFLAGVAFGYYAILPVGLTFLLEYESDRFESLPTADTYLPFLTRTLLASGIVFELPAATYVGAKLGLITAPVLRRFRKHALIVNAVLAAALTPSPDPFSMVLMAVPLAVMYELSIIIARFVNPMVEHEEAMEHSPLSDHLPGEDDAPAPEEDPDDLPSARRDDGPAPERDL
ncbi:MAG: Twin-arginine translocation protein TatC [uncultured Rubrobacteraceae bacterium]|uniref:Sec-independent protein translocase protein TatC n=1 Tax=uncultured Rubrobacteraceae bacterium TaxID=349277 RepID=A0A6J4RZJ0_9ACTN|nr:MAG: Twin-arginine translocation protein TatC [uncultured Rubrobacteraceae bacterium]